MQIPFLNTSNYIYLMQVFAKVHTLWGLTHRCMYKGNLKRKDECIKNFNSSNGLLYLEMRKKGGPFFHNSPQVSWVHMYITTPQSLWKSLAHAILPWAASKDVSKCLNNLLVLLFYSGILVYSCYELQSLTALAAGQRVHAGNVPVIHNGIVGRIRFEWFHPVLVRPHVCSE